MKNYNSFEPLNLGTNEVVTIKELSDIISQTVGFKGSIQFDKTKPDGMMEKSLDSSILLDLGFKPSYTLQKGIEVTYSKFLENH
jgi:GDP-L-fucose synthase